VDFRLEACDRPVHNQWRQLMPALTETLASYVPNLGLRRLAAQDAAAPLEPRADRFHAAALFADISGSTLLAERLAERGAVGAEELSRVLNAYFAQLLDVIAAHGGDVAKFAGDGLLALWPADGEGDDLTAAVGRATQCGMAVQRKLHNYRAEEGIYLSLRIAIGAGEAFVAQVGGAADHWELLVAGAPVVQACAAEAEADPGQVVLSPDAWELARTACTGYPLPTGVVRIASLVRPLAVRANGPPPAFRCADTYLRAFAPCPIIARLAAGQSDWLAELRRVTVLFINVPELDCVADVAHTHDVLRAIQSVLYRYEGSILRIGIDRNGPTVLAGYGLPPLAHEDDAARGVRAALSVQLALHGRGLRSAIGIATGRAFCGSVGNAWQREYTMVADIVNVGARLMQEAGTGILCDAATQEACGTSASFESLPALRVRGKTGPIAVYRPWAEAKRIPRAHTATLIGRHVERTLLAERLQALSRSDAAHAVLIEGEAGIGKSRLIEELCQLARTHGVPCFSGAGDAIEISTPYHAWRTVFTQLLRLDAAPGDPEAQRAHVVARIAALPANDGAGPALSQLLPLLDAVVPLDLPDNELTAQMTAQGRADNTHELLVRLLRDAAQAAPFLIILEDAHWLDSASWALIRLISQRVPAVLLVLVTRPLPDPPPTEYRQLLHAPGTQWLWLDTLSAEDTVSLVCQRLGVSGLPEPVVSFIREKAGGHPFFSEELAYMLRDSGRIVISHGECRMAPDTGDLRALSVPDTVHGVITGRIDRLTPRQQLALKVASVIGREFAFRTLRDIHPIEPDKTSLGEDLDALAQRDLVQIATLEPDLTYRFKHIITQEVAYNLLPFGQRRQLHRSVGEWYERTSGADLAPLSALLAHHWSQAAQATAALAPKAIAYLEKAAAQALGSYANQEALRFLTEALGLDAATRQGAGSRNGAGRRRARWERQLGEAYYQLGNPVEARVHLTQALLLFGHRVPSARFKVLISLIGQVGRQVLHRMSPAIFIGHARQDKRATLLESARAYETLALVSFIAAETLASINGNLHGLNLAEAAGPSPELANSYAMVGLLAGLIAQPRVAERYFQFALHTAERVDDRSCMGRVWFTKGYYLLGKGEWAAAREALARAYERFEQLGDRRWCETTVLTLANLNYNQGQFARCGELYTQAYESAHRRGDVQAQAWAMVAKALVPLSLGQADAALETVAALEAWLANSLAPLSDRATEINAYGIRALAHARRGERALALQSIEPAVRLIEQSSPSAYYGLTGYAAAAEVTLTLLEASDVGSAEREKLQRLADHACTALRSFARLFPIGQPQAWLWKGLRDWLAGKPSRAQAAWQKSLVRAERLEMPYEEGLAHFEIGRHLPATDPRRRRHLMRAGEIFSQLGAAYHQACVGVTLDSPTCGSLPQLVLSS